MAAASEREADLSSQLAATQAAEASLRHLLQTAGEAEAQRDAVMQAVEDELAVHEQRRCMLTGDLEQAKQVQAESINEVARPEEQACPSSDSSRKGRATQHAEAARELQGQIIELQREIASAEEAAAAAEAALKQLQAEGIC